MTRYIYLAVTADRYELPIAVADTTREMADICGISESRACKSIKEHEQNAVKQRTKRFFVRTKMEDDQ